VETLKLFCYSKERTFKHKGVKKAITKKNYLQNIITKEKEKIKKYV